MRGADGLTVTAPPLMWACALDVLLERLRADGMPFSRLAAVSGAGQQHGSVYWRRDAGRAVLEALDPDRTLGQQLEGAFALEQSPVWMDSSTTEQCTALERAVGGALELARITGSRAYERFTGSQIAKVYQQRPAAYEQCECIGLVSSFACSLLLGGYAPIDYSDASGMNLMDIRRKDWHPPALDACAPGLRQRLGPPVASSTLLGPIAPYFVARYGVPPSCRVVAFVGDNPASLAGMRLGVGDVALSLGTSDTLFTWLPGDPQPQLMGHVFCNPVDSSAYMALLCYKNGSLVRQAVRDRCAGGSWATFDALLAQTPAGNDGCIAVHFEDTEITPAARGTVRADGAGRRVAAFDAAHEVRALVEGQLLAKRAHAQALGHDVRRARRLLATGGASANHALLRVAADVFGVPVYVLDLPDSAALGCAYRALHTCRAAECHGAVSFAETLRGAPDATLAAMPDPHVRRRRRGPRPAAPGPPHAAWLTRRACAPSTGAQPLVPPLAGHRTMAVRQMHATVYEGLMERYRQLERELAASYAARLAQP